MTHVVGERSYKLTNTIYMESEGVTLNRYNYKQTLMAGCVERSLIGVWDRGVAHPGYHQVWNVPGMWHTPGITVATICPRCGYHSDVRGVTHPPPPPAFCMKHMRPTWGFHDDLASPTWGTPGASSTQSRPHLGKA